MGIYPRYYACDKVLLDRFMDAAESDDPYWAVDQLENDLHKRKDEFLQFWCDERCIDIHRLLTNDVSAKVNFAAGKDPLRLCMFGGEMVLTSNDRTMTLIGAGVLPGLCQALAGIDQKWLGKRMESMQGKVRRYNYRLSDKLEDVWVEFCQVRDFYHKAAASKSAVIGSILH